MTDQDEIIAAIKSTGHWRIVARPTVFQEGQLATHDQLWDLIGHSQVRLAAREYPEIDDQLRGTGDDWVWSALNFGDRLEYWRFFFSGQFVHLASFWEDKRTVPWTSSAYADTGGKAQKYLEIDSLLYQITELYLFLQRLALSSDLFKPSVEVIIELHDTKDRELVYWHIGRKFLGRRYACADEEVTYRRVVSCSELVGSADGLALLAMTFVANRFDWQSPPVELFKEEQKKFMERRL